MDPTGWQEHQLSWCEPARIGAGFFAACKCGSTVGPLARGLVERLVGVHVRDMARRAGRTT